MLDNVKVYSIKPENFSSQIEVASIYVEIGEEVLFLQRSDSEQGLWGVPAGKLKQGETAESAAKRELLEETGIMIHSASSFVSFGKLFIRKPNMDYVLHMFRLTLTQKPQIILSKEHQNSNWIIISEVEQYPLMQGTLAALSHCKDMIRIKKESKANINVYLIVKRQDQILLYLRKNTGYCDGYYGLVSGHVEAKESALEGLIREAKEEAGITIHPNHLHFVHCMHRQTNRLNIDLFFECEVYQGDITNKEPEKCASLQFFSLNALPANMITYIADAIKHSTKKEFYSEQGWID